MSDLAVDDNGRLVWREVARDIEARIKSGELQPGTRLRSERELAEYYQCAYGTVRRAIADLRERGYIITEHGRGNYIAIPDQGT